MIECEYVPSNLCLIPEYEALRCVWGKSTAPKYMRLDGKLLQITLNLYDSLVALRQRSKPQRLLRFDAVRINQRDIDDRNQQVPS